VKQLLLIVAVAGIPLMAAAQAPSSGGQSREGFGGSLSVLSKGTSEPVAVAYRTWMLPQGVKIDDFAGGSGNLVVEVAAGVVTTVIDGQRQVRQFGEFFVVPAGRRLQIVTTNRSAILHTLRLGP
jgi:gentisate 1,2-dioxygenase